MNPAFIEICQKIFWNRWKILQNNKESHGDFGMPTYNGVLLLDTIVLL